ncbi:F-box domain-containing protein [Mycena chlorophos]|uniref:F-box domain-containing protein n=1 Tax=Mycena chlorophos TaxID=658473 RepID=A0A8H6THQ5_MYCCL|nr:F-box domain-containing protein [Mycena chlorophos]
MPSASHILISAVVTWLAKSLISRVLSIRLALRHLHAPFAGFHLLNPFYVPAILLGSWFPRLGAPALGAWTSKFAPYAEHRSTAVAGIVVHNACPMVWFADAESIKYITTETSIFTKDPVPYDIVNFYGKNIISAEGADWRRHRRITRPAFNESGNAFVWKETLRISHEWFSDLKMRAESSTVQDSFVINAGEDLSQASMLVIASAGFGHRSSWKDDGTVAPGHALTFRQALFLASAYGSVKVLTPSWLYTLSEHVYVPLAGRLIRDTQTAFEALRVHMLELVGMARAWVIEGKIDAGDAALLRNLVEANMDVSEGDVHKAGDNALTESELLSNSFIFLFAGHETTAHTLTFAVGLLALYPQVQQKIYRETLALWPDGIPTLASTSSYRESFSQLPYTLAIFYETLRLFPAVIRIARLVRADTTVPAYRFNLSPSGVAEKVQNIVVPVSAGSQVMYDIRALHHNPMYWGADADEFKPERFLDTESYRWPRDAFIPFSAGPRICIGQKFAVTEGVCLLATLVRTFELTVPEPLRQAPFEQQKESILAWRAGQTMEPTSAYVQLTRR